VPVHLRGTGYAGAKRLGHGEGYRYPHDFPDAVLPGSLMPDGLEDLRLYHPTDRGPEGRLAERLERLRRPPEGADGPF
jgi:putative ATPase